MKRAVDGVVELLYSPSNETGVTESCDSQPIAKGDRCKVKKVCFTDDLRTEDFTYIVSESSNNHFVVLAVKNFSVVASMLYSAMARLYHAISLRIPKFF